MGNTLERASGPLNHSNRQLRLTSGDPATFIHFQNAIAEIESHCSLAHSAESYPGKAKHLLALQSSLQSNIKILNSWKDDESLSLGSRAWARDRLPGLETLLGRTVDMLKPGGARVVEGSSLTVGQSALDGAGFVAPRIQPLVRFETAVSSSSVINLPPLAPGQSRFKEQFDD